MGLFITLDPPTSAMTSEAISAGFHHSELWQRDYPKLHDCAPSKHCWTTSRASRFPIIPPCTSPRAASGARPASKPGWTTLRRVDPRPGIALPALHQGRRSERPVIPC